MSEKEELIILTLYVLTDNQPSLTLEGKVTTP